MMVRDKIPLEARVAQVAPTRSRAFFLPVISARDCTPATYFSRVRVLVGEIYRFETNTTHFDAKNEEAAGGRYKTKKPHTQVYSRPQSI